MKGLMLHCGSQLRSRDEVFAVPVPPATVSYVPVSYESLVTRIEKQVAAEGFTILEEKLALAKNGQRLFGLMRIELSEFPTRDYGCVLGLRNSYDKSCSTGLCIGASVFVCDNLSFQGSQVTFQRKHTTNLLRDLSWQITQTIAMLPVQFATQSRTFEIYRETPLSDQQAHDLVIQFYDKHALNLSDIPGVLKEWRAPRHPEFVEAGKTAWRLFNAATETIKGDLWRLPPRTNAIHEVLDEALQIQPNSIEELAVTA
ncbi:MAG: DUF932 domain-containing protein [Verrucomicrobia bacterium]|nr:DUF932 domain-containing protein [Verrucomicrobiota bacterium]